MLPSARIINSVIESEVKSNTEDLPTTTYHSSSGT